MGIFKKDVLNEWVDIIKKEFSNENYIEAMCTAHAID